MALSQVTSKARLVKTSEYGYKAYSILTGTLHGNEIKFPIFEGSDAYDFEAIVNPFHNLGTPSLILDHNYVGRLPSKRYLMGIHYFSEAPTKSKMSTENWDIAFRVKATGIVANGRQFNLNTSVAVALVVNTSSNFAPYNPKDIKSSTDKLHDMFASHPVFGLFRIHFRNPKTVDAEKIFLLGFKSYFKRFGWVILKAKPTVVTR